MYPVFVVGFVSPLCPSLVVCGFLYQINCRRCDGGIGRWAGEIPVTVVGVVHIIIAMPHAAINVISFVFSHGGL